jgi:carbon-monoxide dehydrogenase medium subunit/xanthine dehydrogenase FAD-binding subunit
MDPSGRKFQDVRLAIGGVGPTAKRMTAVEERLNGQSVNADLLRDVMLSCDRFVQSRSRQEYRKLVTPGFLARGLAKAIRKAGASAGACDIAEEVAHG